MIKSDTLSVNQLIVSGLLCFLLQIIAYPLQAKEQSDLVIVNSDLSIKKYALTQQLFEANYKSPVTVINLADYSQKKASYLIKKNKSKTIYAIGSKAYLLSQQVAENKNIVFSSIINWQRLTVTKHSYGVAQELPTAMQLTMFRYLFPEIKRVGVLYSKQYNKEWLLDAIEAAKNVGIGLIAKDVDSKRDLSSAIAGLLPTVDVLWLIADPVVLANKAAVNDIFKQTKNRQKPVFTYSQSLLDLGAVLVISADLPTISGQVSALVDELNRNKITITEQVYKPAGSHIILNMKQLKKYPIKLNKEALGSVNQIIE
ncbi:MAG: hypothetical protein KAT04_04535 [Methylococcales bacterium]|nr:hypothetical protein [Methylococcales bacterium]